MDVFIKILQLILSLSILVLFHEAGHFMFAKLFKVKVEKFYIFFDAGFSLFKFRKGDTEYGMGWIPFGGYVKIAGMIDESLDLKQMKEEPKPWEFRSKPAWQRLLIMAGGVIVNVVLAFFIYIMVLYSWGEAYLPMENVKYGVVCDSAFINIGLRDGDKILAIDQCKLERFSDIIPEILLNKSKTIQVEREGRLLTIPIPETFIDEILDISSRSYKVPMLIAPRIKTDGLLVRGFTDHSPAYDAGMRVGDTLLAIDNMPIVFADDLRTAMKKRKSDIVETVVLRNKDTLRYSFLLREDGLMGVEYSLLKQLEYAVKYYSFVESVPAGIKMGVGELKSYVKQLKLIFSSGTKVAKSVGGFGSIANVFPGVWNWHSFWVLTALISIMLAVMNILPIPALDGGHVLFLLYEIITRRKMNEKFMEYAQIGGMMFILALFILANMNDVIKFFR